MPAGLIFVLVFVIVSLVLGLVYSEYLNRKYGKLNHGRREGE